MINYWENIYQNNYNGNTTILCQPLINYINTINSEDIILDYGGGSGRTTEYINKIYPQNKIHIYDISSVAIENSYKNIVKNNYILRSSKNFIPLLPYTKIIAHRVMHNMLDTDIDNFINTIRSHIKTDTTIFISVKSKNCIKYQKKLNDIKFIKKDEGFYNPNTNRYVKFYSLSDLFGLLKQHNITLNNFGVFVENSFKNHTYNEYIYATGKF